VTVRRIIGCPGGGKTHKLEELAQRAAGTYGASNVLAVSLTRTAAAEIGGRDTGIPDENCATLHAHALRALEITHDEVAETPAVMRQFNAAHEGLIASANTDGWAGEDDGARGQASAVHAAVTNHRARMTPTTEWSNDERAYDVAWQDFCVQTGRYDFTTMIERCIDEHVDPLSAPRVILADEAQDFTRLEFGLLMQWAKSTDATVIVGDTEQCIFWFRGADPEALEQVPIARSESLTQSYRVPRAVHAAATTWVSQLPGPNVHWQPRDADGAVDLAPYALRDAADTADAAIESAREQTTMVLASCRYMLGPLVAELKARGEPFANPWRETEAAWNPLAGAGTRALLALLAPRPDAHRRMWTWGDLQALTEPMQASALARGAKASIKAHCMVDELCQTHINETVPLDTLFTLLGTDDPPLLGIDRDLRAALDWWTAGLSAKGHGAARYPLAVLDAHGAAGLKETPRLTIGTAHSVKGGEAAHVLVAPEISKEGFYEGWLGGGAARDAIVRQFYVACTRAREKLTVLDAGCPEYAPLPDVIRKMNVCV